jgi:hypothetical protein
MAHEARAVAEYYTSWAVMRCPDDMERILAALMLLSVIRFAPDISASIIAAHRATHGRPASQPQYVVGPRHLAPLCIACFAV